MYYRLVVTKATTSRLVAMRATYKGKLHIVATPYLHVTKKPKGYLNVSDLPFFDWKKAKEYEKKVLESLKRENDQR